MRALKANNKGTSPIHWEVTASAKPEMKPDSFNKMSISPRRVECFKDLGKSTLRRPIFESVRRQCEMSSAPLALQYFANITAVVSSRVCIFINGKKLHHRQVCAGTENLQENKKNTGATKGLVLY